MSSKMYPMSKPVLIDNMSRSEEECKIIRSWTGPIGYQLIKRKLTVQWEVGGPSVSNPAYTTLVIPPNCAQPFLVLLHQHGVYVNMLKYGEPKVKEGLMDPADLQSYVSVAAYLRDVILAFMEEWEGEGFKAKFRSARLEFHMAMALTGGAFTDRNMRKVQKRFNVTWNDFVGRVEVTDIMKLNGKEAAYHEAVCGKDENMCGLDDYPSITHTKESLRMIERFIKDREALWAAKKKDVQSEATERDGRASKGKKAAREAPSVPAESTKGEEVVRKTRGAKKRAKKESKNRKNSQKSVRNALADGGTIQENVHDGNVDTHEALNKLDALAISSRHEPSSDATEDSTAKTILPPAAPPRREGPISKTVQIGASGNVNTMKGPEAKTDVSKPPVQTTTSTDLMMRAFAEGNGHQISRNLLNWMIQRFRTLVGVPLDEPLNGQVIPQSPDEYEDLTEHDYLEALGIERLYAALLNAEESPGHLVHLAHALGRAANETNVLSYSKPDTPALEPLPPTMLPLPKTMASTDDLANSQDALPDLLEGHHVSAYDDLGATGGNYENFSSTGLRQTDDDDDDYVDDTSDRSEQSGTAGLTDADDGSPVTSERATPRKFLPHAHSDDGSSSDHDSSPIYADEMDVEIVKGGDCSDDSDVMDGESKRKRTGSLALSPPVVLLHSLDETNIHITNQSYQSQGGRGNRKRPKTLSSIMDDETTASTSQPAFPLAPATSMLGVWTIPGDLHKGPSAMEEDSGSDGQ
ncbi:hypothetical protein DEU56DRAFT_760646 [Suillus clintonianus]|uniref:uncharacterized protein n=1 Tax=Suillus clintonianus TaxID=1904413 RepID=UPI001B868BA1|nr:uncharacterized protein DEU56DRAFT_760646 [Suillus clintonianus]KAG2121472.1 hypothetical protein DEU56DRAFT_760646 [Suillus clintonianus]